MHPTQPPPAWKRVPPPIPLTCVVLACTLPPHPPLASPRRQVGHSEHAYVQFLDLVERMLDYDPATRIKPMQALNHPFLREEEVPSSPLASSTMPSTLPTAGEWGGARSTRRGALAGLLLLLRAGGVGGPQPPSAPCVA
jgi:serine/threonine protein kinase